MTFVCTYYMSQDNFKFLSCSSNLCHLESVLPELALTKDSDNRRKPGGKWDETNINTLN